jgi:hypothetical protein
MSKLKTLIGVICVCVTMISATAPAAQAAPPEWMVNGLNVSSELKVELGITVDHPVAFLSTAAGASIAISCSTITAHPFVLLAGGVAHGTLLFSGCETTLNGSSSGACKPQEPIAAKGLLLLVLHALVSGKHDPVLLAEPEAGKPFTRLSLGAEEECAIGEEFEIGGDAKYIDCEGKGEEDSFVHLFEEVLGGGLFFGVNKATVDGSIFVTLSDGGLKLYSLLPA